MNSKKWLILPLVGLISSASLSEAGQVSRTSSETGAKTWEIETQGVTLSLTQILPDQARAFYVNRGFTVQQAEAYATSCIYMTVLRNDSAPSVIHYVLQDWSVVVNGKSNPPMKIDDWLFRLKKERVKKSALIAFRWAQFPPEQTYEPGGDWNQGMLAMGLPAASKFKFVARWDMNNERYEGVLHDVHCAK